MTRKLIALVAALILIGYASAEERYVQINYDETSYDKLGYASPEPGNKFLVVDLSIENHGYGEVEISPLDFSITTDNVEYDIDMSTYFNLADLDKATLDSVKLKDGGKISGSIAFQVPETSTEYLLSCSENYDIKYGDL